VRVYVDGPEDSFKAWVRGQQDVQKYVAVRERERGYRTGRLQQRELEKRGHQEEFRFGLQRPSRPQDHVLRNGDLGRFGAHQAIQDSLRSLPWLAWREQATKEAPPLIWKFWNATNFFTFLDSAPRQPQRTERLHHQRDSAQGGQGLFERLGIHFEQ
jgi:hypothetical protein